MHFLLVAQILTAQLAAPIPAFTPGETIRTSRQNLCNPAIKPIVPPITEDMQAQVRKLYNVVGDTHFDTLIPYELGGAASVKNVWPVDWNTRRDTLIAKVALEHQLKLLVCQNKLSLRDAQRELTNDWRASYIRRMQPAQ